MSSITGLEARSPVLETSSSTSAAEPSGPNEGQRALAGGPPLGARVREWFLRSEALAQARNQQLGARQRGALRAALQSLELANRAVDLPEGYHAGPPLGATLALYQDAVWWTLQAVDEGAPAESLAQACARHAALLGRLAGSEQEYARLRAQLLEPDRHSFQALDEASQLALIAAARRFTGTLVVQVGAPDERLARVSRSRWLRPLLVLGAIAALALALALTLRPEDIAAGKRWTASSGEWDFAQTGTTDKFGNEDLLFHTHAEDNPWLMVDLEKVGPVSAVVLENRAGCCQERAVPLVVELSVDGRGWREVARTQDVFTTYKASFATSPARFVRLRVLRNTTFHLRRVRVLK